LHLDKANRQEWHWKVRIYTGGRDFSEKGSVLKGYDNFDNQPFSYF